MIYVLILVFTHTATIGLQPKTANAVGCYFLITCALVLRDFTN